MKIYTWEEDGGAEKVIGNIIFYTLYICGERQKERGGKEGDREGRRESSTETDRKQLLWRTDLRCKTETE